MKIIFRFILVCFLSVIWGNHGFAQKRGQAKIDSIIKEVSNAKEDTNKVKLLKDLSMCYYNTNTDEGIKYGQMAFGLAEKLGWKKGMASSNNSIGSNFVSKSDFSKAIEYFTASEKGYDETGDKKRVVGYGAYVID